MSAHRKICSVSVDLDAIGCYYGIYGLGAPPETLKHVVLRRGLARFVELFERRNIKATFFVVGDDVTRRSAGRPLVEEVARLGHEIGNHSMSHRYEMARLGPEEADAEVGRAHEILTEVAGRAPVGFRAPGYDLSPSMLAAIGKRTYRYDSSIYPAPLYWMAKAAAMGAMALVGRPSGSVIGDPRALIAPLMPYRPDAAAPWKRGQAPVVELPISVTKGLRIPVIGTYVLTAPEAVRTRLLESMRGRGFFNFELHGIDLCGADEDGIPGELVSRQVDLRVSLTDKRRALEATLDRLAHDFEFAPLREVATVVQREGESAFA